MLNPATLGQSKVATNDPLVPSSTRRKWCEHPSHWQHFSDLAHVGWGRDLCWAISWGILPLAKREKNASTEKFRSANKLRGGHRRISRCRLQCYLTDGPIMGLSSEPRGKHHSQHGVANDHQSGRIMILSVPKPQHSPRIYPEYRTGELPWSAASHRTTLALLKEWGHNFKVGCDERKHASRILLFDALGVPGAADPRRLAHAAR